MKIQYLILLLISSLSFPAFSKPTCQGSNTGYVDLRASSSEPFFNINDKLLANGHKNFKEIHIPSAGLRFFYGGKEGQKTSHRSLFLQRRCGREPPSTPW